MGLVGLDFWMVFRGFCDTRMERNYFHYNYNLL